MTSALVLAVAGAVAGPVAGSPGTRFEFGKLRESSAIVHEFVVQNSGDTPLVLKRVRSTCGGCITVKLVPGTEVKAGESLAVTATLRGRGLRGPVKKHFYVETNDPTRPALQFTFEGEVKPLYVMTPTNSFMLQTVRLGKAQEWPYELALVELPDCTITKVEAPPGFSVEVAAGATQARHRLLVRTDGQTLKPGLVRDKVVVHTDLAAARTIDIPFSAQVAGEIAPFPPELYLGVPATGGAADAQSVRPQVRQLFLRKDSPGAFRVTRVVPPRPEITAEVNGPTSGSLLRLNVGLRGVLPMGKVGDLIISTDCPECPEVRIPVSVARGVEGKVEAAPEVEPEVKAQEVVRPALPADQLLAEVAKAYSRQQAGVRLGDPADEAANVTVWLADKLSGPGRNHDQVRQELGGISLVRYARARDMVALRLTKDPEFAARCQRLLESLQARMATPGR